MSESQITAIYDTLAGLSITAGGKTPVVRDLDQLPDSAETAHLPARLLLPSGVLGPSATNEGQYVTINKGLLQVTWHIRDLCLWRPIGQGLGLASIMPTLVEYAGKYFDAITATRQMTHQAYIANARVDPTILEWPDQSGRVYFAVDAYVDVIEIIST